MRRRRRVSRNSRQRNAAGMALALALMTAPPGAAAANPASACVGALAAEYGARHMEMGGGLVLRPDGRFHYELSYGALDEMADGTWTCDQHSVFLTSDPVTPPRFVLESLRTGRKGDLHVTLDVPAGMSRQYFSVLIRRADGTGERLQFDEEGLSYVFSGERPVTVVPVLELYELIGEPIKLPAGDGFDIRLRFAANDLGKVAFSRTVLERDGRNLMLRRFDTTIRFAPQGI